MKQIPEEIYDFIKEHHDDDPKLLSLSLHDKDLPFSLPFALIQLESRKKTSSKLSKFLANKRFLFPDSIASEQATDERVAQFHKQLVGTGKSILDLTAGLGIDAMSMAMNNNRVVAIEINSEKSDILNHNRQLFGLENLRVVNEDCRTYLKDNKEKFDIVFIDPARRGAYNTRKHSLEDCEPDVIKLMPDIFDISPLLMIKVSPLLDITKLIKDIRFLENIYAVCVKGECKELLLQLRNNASFKSFRIVDLNDEGIFSDIEFSLVEMDYPTEHIISEDNINDEFLNGKYLYEPNAGVMKLPRKSSLCVKFNDLYQLGSNTALFISDHYYPKFPGRILKIDKIAEKKDLSGLKDCRYNIVCRNYPLKPDELRKKFKIKEGNNKFIYAFRIGKSNRPIICLTHKI